MWSVGDIAVVGYRDSEAPDSNVDMPVSQSSAQMNQVTAVAGPHFLRKACWVEVRIVGGASRRRISKPAGNSHLRRALSNRVTSFTAEAMESAMSSMTMLQGCPEQWSP